MLQLFSPRWSVLYDYLSGRKNNLGDHESHLGGACGSCSKWVKLVEASSLPWCPPAVARGGFEDVEGGVSVYGLTPVAATVKMSSQLRRTSDPCYGIKPSNYSDTVTTNVDINVSLCSLLFIPSHLPFTVHTKVLVNQSNIDVGGCSQL